LIDFEKQKEKYDLDPPVVIISNDLIQSRLYENVTLECSVFSRPLANISWEKNDKIIEENPLNTISINQTMSQNRLKIQVREHIFSLNQQISIDDFSIDEQ
jgi:hypothetical protein